MPTMILSYSVWGDKIWHPVRIPVYYTLAICCYVCVLYNNLAVLTVAMYHFHFAVASSKATEHTSVMKPFLASSTLDQFPTFKLSTKALNGYDHPVIGLSLPTVLENFICPYISYTSVKFMLILLDFFLNIKEFVHDINF